MAGEDKNRPRIKNVIFDWSGTISDDFGILYEIVMELFDKKGAVRISRETFLRSYSLPYMISINQFIDIGKDEWDSMFREAWHKKGFPKPFPEAEGTLDWLKSKGILMAVLTSHPESFIRREMRKYFGEKEFFKEVFADAYDKKDAIHGALQKLGFPPEETIFVGDTVHDIETGKHAGVVTAAVLSGYNTEEQLRAAEPDIILKTVAELKRVIGANRPEH